MKKTATILIVFLFPAFVNLCMAVERKGATVSASQISFQDVTAQWAIITAEGSHDVTWADVDDDGFPDLYLPYYWVGTVSDLFFWNDSGQKFMEQAELRGIADPDGGSHGGCFADLDNDGDYDLINGTTAAAGWSPYGPDHNNVFINRGDGYFDDITPSIPDIFLTKQPTRAVCAFDMDGDGDLDIFSVSGYQGTDEDTPDQNEIYRNDGNLQFTALSGHILETTPAGQGVVDTDFDLDGDMDLIIANRTGDLNLLRNIGGGQFVRVPPAEIGIQHRAGDGITSADVDNDGDPDLLLVTGDEHAGQLYLNQGNGTFIFDRSFPNILGYMGGFMDVDNDGDLDLFFPYEGPVLLNDGTGHFQPGPVLPFTKVVDTRGIAFADIDNDGHVDMATGDKHTYFRLVRNTSTDLNGWLKVRLVSPEGQAGAFGAKITVYPAGELNGTLLGFRECHSFGGYLAEDDPVKQFGLGLNDRVDVLVRFLDGRIATRRNVAANQTLKIDRADLCLRIRVFLEGVYDITSHKMTTDLSDQRLIPLTSPYPQDRITVSSLPEGTVDWVLLEILNDSATSESAVYRSLFLLSDGSLTDGLDSLAAVHLDVAPGLYRFVLSHRNHLPVSTGIYFSLTDTTGETLDLAHAPSWLSSKSRMTQVESGIFALIAGNTDDRDDEILASDLALIKQDEASVSPGYNKADINLDGLVSETDYNIAARHMLEGAYSLVERP